MPNESSYGIAEENFTVERSGSIKSLQQLIHDSSNVIVGEVVKKEVTASPIFGIITKSTFSIIGVLKGKHRPHEKIIIREWGAQQPEHLHEKQILLESFVYKRYLDKGISRA
ncbi:hypothetical protein [Aeriscardovia aeriphila]|uniref:hypothetical protein n=1 Tax=Aeriscardovia aeriphila TaxID=218139 RepID=UPI000B9BD6E8|nr:hypothetical protein [Aeriscardovia aeriphila]NYI25343.1 hypothetical protein [Aeriscardovia aeriphila]